MSSAIRTPQGAGRTRPTADHLRSWLVRVVSDIVGTGPEDIDPSASFDRYGISSAEAVNISGQLEELLDTAMSPTVLYDHPTINQLAAHLGGQPSAPAAPQVTDRAPAPARDSLCLVGMACRLPGKADTPAQFWDNLLGSVDAAAVVPSDRWNADDHYSPDLDRPGRSYTKLGGFVSDIAGFDSEFFGLSPREALRMDPQQRLLLEVAWEAIEDAGVAADRLRGSRTGVFVGMMASNQYGSLQIEGEGRSVLDDPYFGMGTAPSVVAGRLSYLLDLHGPSVFVDTACSSALVAVHLAAASLRAGETDLAVVGGVSAILHPDAMRQACKMRMLAQDGACKTFDERADGFLMGEGCGVVVLERWSDAVANGHHVLALLRGSAVNQDGASNGLTAPNGPAQVAVIRDALAAAGVAPEQIGYVEAHGSGTLLGDSIEMSGLHEVFGPGRSVDRPLVVGAVKTNVGHLTGAAGMAGLIKTVLALRHDRIPPNLHLANRNPAIDWDRCPTLLPDAVVPWPTGDGPRLAGVSSFGWSGTNAHCVLEAPPVVESAPVEEATHAVVLSARTRTGLSSVAARLATLLRDQPDTDLAAVAATTQLGRTALEYRATVTCADTAAAVTALDAIATRGTGRHVPKGRATPVTFLLPGSGDQYEGMGAQLYESDDVFRAGLDRCADLLREPLGCDIRTLIHPADRKRSTGPDLRAMLGRGPATSAASPLFDRLDVAHAAVFAVDYACAETWLSWGVRPSSLLGYSLGEYVAACLAGVLSLEDALNLVVRRAELVRSAPTGAMLAVGESAERLGTMLTGELSLAAVNGPRMCVVAGTEVAVAAFEQRLRAVDVASRRIPSTHAMHSALLDPLRAELADLVGSFTLHAPEIPFVSNVTGTWITAEQAVDPHYWAAHMCQTVQFAPGVLELATRERGVLLETGPGQLASLATQVLGTRRDLEIPVFSTLRSSSNQTTDRHFWLRAASGLWSSGAAVDWRRAHPAPVRTVSLPSYPFEHQRFWPGGGAPSVAAEPATTPDKPADLADWCYAPVWRQSVDLVSDVDPEGHGWLLFEDARGLLGGLADLLRARGATVATVCPGAAFGRDGDSYVIAPDSAEDYRTLVGDVVTRQRFPDRVVHGWTVDTTPDAPLAERIAGSQTAGLHSVLHIVRALAEHDADRQVDLLAVTSGAHEILGGDGVAPDKAAVLGATRTIAQEFPTFRCRAVDLRSPERGTRLADRTVRQLLGEVLATSTDDVVAYRDRHRWVRDFRPVRPERGDRVVWRDNGVYLITGGTGELGLMLARHLHRTTGARLALLSRTPLPAREDWPGIVADRPADDPLRVRLTAVTELEQAGAQVLHLVADVGDPAAVRSAIAAVDAEFGALHGVLHAAGVPGGGLIRFRTSADADLVLRPKVAGTAALYDALADRKLDFLALFSSAVVAIGGLGESDYSAANCFLDAFAAASATDGIPVVAIDWGPWRRDAWQAAALASMPELRATMRELRDRFGITDEEGTELLSRIIGSGLPQVLVLPQDVGAFAARWSSFAGIDSLSGRPASGIRYPRPELACDYVAPRTDVERTVARTWADNLGLEKVGVDDVFFELGGNSLIGLTIITRLEREFGSKIPAATLFEAPTVRTLSALIAGGPAEPAPLDRETGRGSRRRKLAGAASARRAARKVLET
jgi:acyl transferase domain-containing protein/acyl carrier protein